MIFKEHPKRDRLVTGIVVGITLMIILSAALPFIVQNNTIKALLLVVVVVIAGYPIFKHFYKGSKGKSKFEQKHGRKLK